MVCPADAIEGGRPFKLVGKIGYADAGGVADITTSPATQLGYYYAPLMQSGANAKVEPDTSLQRTFFLGNSVSTSNPTGHRTALLLTTRTRSFRPTLSH
jgi:hypothetical protein